MILPQSKRVLRFDAFPGKTVHEVVESLLSIRILFTDGTVAAIDTPSVQRAVVVQNHGTPELISAVQSGEVAVSTIGRFLF